MRLKFTATDLFFFFDKYDMKKKAIILAASTEGMPGAEVPNQFISLGGKPLLYYSIHAFLESFPDMEVIVVLPEGYVSMGQEIVDGYFDESRVVLCQGGENRFESVRHGLARVEDDEYIVFIHEATRCFVTPDLISRCYKAALYHQAVVPVISCHDGVRLYEGETYRSVDRTAVRLVQTPQAFHSRILKMAFEIDYKPYFTDETIILEAFGINIFHIPGEEQNFRVVSPRDRLLASEILETKGDR